MIGSAYWIAAARARESLRPDRLFDDPYAAGLAGARGFAALEASERASGGENPFLPVRTRFFDDVIVAAVASGVTQVVLLGAGLDTRAYRLGLPADTTLFETDRPEVFAAKSAVLREFAGGGTPGGATGRSAIGPACALTTVPMDLAVDPSSRLVEAGFDADAAAAWVAEGLFFYLSPGAVAHVLAEAAAIAAPGSLFVADIMGAAIGSGPGMAAYREYRERAGEPPPFGHDTPGELFEAAGWGVRLATWAGAPDASFGRFPAPPMPPSTGASHAGPAHRAHLIIGEQTRGRTAAKPVGQDLR